MIKTNIKENSAEPKPTFPALYISKSGRVVLFTSEGCGTQLQNPSSNSFAYKGEIGLTRSKRDEVHWDDTQDQNSIWELFTGVLELSNA